MEDPQVLREIDALIDSYNWGSLNHMGERFAEMFKEAYRTQSTDIFFDFNALGHPTQLRLFQIFLDLLKHPHTRHKAWLLESMTHLISLTERSQPHSPGLTMETRRLFHEGEILLRRYARHCRPVYRRHAVISLARLMPHPDDEICCYLEAMRRERSFAVLVHIVEHLQALFLHGTRYRIHPSKQVRADVLMYADTLLKSRNLLMRLLARTFYLHIIQEDTSQAVLDGIVADWTRLNPHREWHDSLLRAILYSLHFLDGKRCRAFGVVLLRNSRHTLTAQIVYDDLDQYFLSSAEGSCRTAFTSWEYSLLDAMIGCDPLWRTSNVTHDDEDAFTSHLSHSGLETTRWALRQQVLHARLIEEEELKGPTQKKILPLFWNAIAIQARNDVSTATLQGK